MQIGNWVETRQNCLMLSALVFTPLTWTRQDKTRQFRLFRVCGVNKLNDLSEQIRLDGCLLVCLLCTQDNCAVLSVCVDMKTQCALWRRRMTNDSLVAQ